MRLMGLSVAYLCIGIPLAFYSAAVNVGTSLRYSDYSWSYMHSAVRRGRHHLCTVTNVPNLAFLRSGMSSRFSPRRSSPSQTSRTGATSSSLSSSSRPSASERIARRCSLRSFVPSVDLRNHQSRPSVRKNLQGESAPPCCLRLRLLTANLLSVSVSPSDSCEAFRERSVRARDIGRPNSSCHPTRLAGTLASVEESKSWWKKSATSRSLERIQVYSVREPWSAAARTVTWRRLDSEAKCARVGTGETPAVTVQACGESSTFRNLLISSSGECFPSAIVAGPWRHTDFLHYAPAHRPFS
jgi:hypothetical protein